LRAQEFVAAVPGSSFYHRNELGHRMLRFTFSKSDQTLTAAAERLGWDYTYDTQVFAAGEIDSGTLRGDLIVVGSGDPSVTDKEAEALFAGWAERLKSSGVRTIIGRIVGDDDAFEDNGLGFGWSWDDLPDDYAAGVSALQYNENAVRVTIAPGPAAGDSAGISITPPGSGLVVVSSLAVTGKNVASWTTIKGCPYASVAWLQAK